MDLTRTDHRLIAALRRDARKSISELSRQLDLSRTTVQKRLTRLESAGIISAYQVKLGEEYRAGTLQAYVSLVVKPRYSAAVATALEAMDEVEALYTVSGKIDLVAIMRVNSPSDMDEALDRIGGIKGIEDTDSAMVLATKFDRR